jgi:uncharacterized membrane protein HdeD (DUF308 family)
VSQPIKSIRKAINHCYLVTIIGLVFILLGIWIFRTPLTLFLILATIFSISFLIAEITEIAFALGNRKELNQWEWFLWSVIFSILIGLLLLSNSALSMITLSLYVGFGVLFRSIAGISIAFNLNELGSEYQSIFYLSLVDMILSFLWIWNQAGVDFTLLTITVLIFLLLGVIAVMLSLRMNKLHELPGTLGDRVPSKKTNLNRPTKCGFAASNSLF